MIIKPSPVSPGGSMPILKEITIMARAIMSSTASRKFFIFFYFKISNLYYSEFSLRYHIPSIRCKHATGGVGSRIRGQE